MPPSTRLLFFSTLFALSSALPWSGAEPTASYKPADYVPRPTNIPQSLPELMNRQSVPASTCGWIGGISNSPVVCPSGSSCIWDVIHSVVGCCPDGGDCSTAIYTGCVDGNSPSSASNANIRTCGGGNVCYRNSYPGGYYQYGCGVSSQVATVQTTFSGQSQNSALEVAFTSITFATPALAAVAPSSSTTAPVQSSISSFSSSSTTSSSPSTTSSVISSSRTEPSSSISVSSTSVSSTSVSSTTVPTTSTATAEAAATNSASPTSTPEAKKSNKSAIIAGSVIAALGATFALSTVACLCLRRRARRAHEDFIMRRNVEEKVKYFGNKTSITSSSRGSSDYTSPSGLSNDLEQGRGLTPASTHTSSSSITPSTPIPNPLNIVTDQPTSSQEVTAAQNDIVSPVTPPQYSAPRPNMASLFEAHPGQPWADAPVSPPAPRAFTLFSHPSTSSQYHSRVSSAPEPRRITLTDAPYNSPTEGLSRASTVSYGPPPTPPMRSPERLTRNSTIAQQMALLPREIFQPSPSFQPQALEPHVQVSQIQVPAPKKASPKREYPRYSYAQYSQLKEEGESPPAPEGEDDDTTHSNIRRNDTIGSVNIDNVMNGKEKADAIITERMLADIHPALRRHYGSNASADTAISTFSDSSRYSRSTSGNAPSRSKSRRMDARRSIASRSIAGRSITGRSISGPTTTSADSNTGKAVQRKALPSDAAVKAYGDLQRGGHLAAFLKTQEPHPPVLPPSTIKVPVVTTTYSRRSLHQELEDVPLTSIGDVNGAALRFLGGSIRKPERAVGERVQDLHVDIPIIFTETNSLRPRGEQWRPESRDSNYVAPLRVVSRNFGARAYSGEGRRGAGVPLLGIPVPGEGRGRMVYEV